MNQLRLDARTNVLIGRPDKPVSRRRRRNISQVLADLEEVREAHLPQVFAVGAMAQARQMLFIVVDPESAIPAVAQTIEERLRRLRPREELGIWPVGRGHEIIATVREADCVIGWRD